MKKLITASMMLAMVMGAGASVISVNFDASAGSMDAADLAGAPGVRVDNWNNWTTADSTMGDVETVVDDSGATVAGFTTTINWNNKWTSRDTNTVNDEGLFSDAIDVDGGPFRVDMANIPYAQYNVYVYMRDDGADRAGSFTIGTTTYYARGGLGNPTTNGVGYVLSTDTTAGTAGLNDGWDQGNYVVFTGLTDANIQLELNVAAALNGTKRNKVVGFQIEAIPEPATLVMVAFFGAGVLFIRRRIMM